MKIWRLKRGVAGALKQTHGVGQVEHGQKEGKNTNGYADQGEMILVSLLSRYI